MKNVIVTGSSGMLGSQIIRCLLNENKFNIFGFSKSSNKENKHLIKEYLFDLTDIEKLEEHISNINPDIIIHTAAIVNLQACEDDFNLAKKTHIDVSAQIAKNNALIVYISTDSIFNGNNKDAYKEDDKAKPLNNYSKTKYLGEIAIRSNSSNFIIIRTNIFGFKIPLAHSFVEWALKAFQNKEKIKGFDDVYFNPVYVKHLSKKILKLIDANFKGVINIGSSNFCLNMNF